MHAVIINGSPRVQEYSNTEKIAHAFEEGLRQRGYTCEHFAISNRSSWDDIREAYVKNDEIIIALPLYVECIPGLLLEFLETLPVKNSDTILSFILQGGFAEGAQFRCGEQFLVNLCKYLGVTYGGTLVKGDNFGLRVSSPEENEKILKHYTDMGMIYSEGDCFFREECYKFTGPEVLSKPMRVMIGFVFKHFARKRFEKVATEWGCTKSLFDRPWVA